MNSKTKMALSITAMVMLTIIAITSIIAIFAARQQSFLSNITVKYKATSIEGKVSAKYYVGPEDKAGTDMTTTGESGGATELIFHAADSQLDPNTLNPQGEIELTLEDEYLQTQDKSWVVFEYVFQNGLDGQPVSTDFIATLTFAGTADNILITTAESDTQITDYNTINTSVSNPANFTTSTAVSHNEESPYTTTKYFYVKAEIGDKGADSEFSGAFSWELALDNATYDKLTFTEDGSGYSVKAASDCTGEVIIPATYKGKPVTEIAASAFNDNIRITSITIPESITKIGSDAFRDCEGLVEINFNAKNCSDLPDRSNVFMNAGKSGEGIFVTFGEQVTRVPAGLFKRVDYTYTNKPAKIKSVAIGSNVTSIGHEAFKDCTTLSKIQYNGTLKQWCESITDLDELLGSGRDLYIGNKKIENELIITDDVTNINPYAFYYIDDIKSVSLGASVESIGSNAFYNCRSLTSVIISESVTNIGYQAFSNCAALTEIKFNAINCGNLKKDTDVFSNTGKSGDGIIVIFGEQVTKIPAYLFYYIDNLISVTIGSNVKTISDYTFYRCTSLTNFTIPEGVINIGKYAFSGCSTLTRLTIPENVTSIGSGAFYNCTALTEINFNARDCADLTKDTDAFSFGKSVASGEGINVTFGDQVAKIPAYLFYVSSSSYKPKIVSVTIGSNVESIGYGAFTTCDNLNQVIIDSQTIFNAISSSSSSNGYLTNYLQSGTGTVKILADIDNDSNEYLKTSFTKGDAQEEINGKMYNVYTKN